MIMQQNTFQKYWYFCIDIDYFFFKNITYLFNCIILFLLFNHNFCWTPAYFTRYIMWFYCLSDFFVTLSYVCLVTYGSTCILKLIFSDESSFIDHTRKHHQYYFLDIWTHWTRLSQHYIIWNLFVIHQNKTYDNCVYTSEKCIFFTKRSNLFSPLNA